MSVILASQLTGAAVLSSCTTNFDWRQDLKRFSESVNGSLSQPADFDAPGSNDFTFAVFGDSHYGMSDGTTSIISRGFTSIESDSSISFIMGIGDLTNTGKGSQYDKFVNLKSALTSKPFYAAVGNHDTFFNGWNHFKQHFGRAVYTFQVDHATFIVLDSASAGMHKAQFEWFEAQLAMHSTDVVIVCMHVPVYTGIEGHYLLWDDPEQGYRFMALAKKYNVDLVLQSHYHTHDEIDVGGVHYVVTGNWNTELDGGTPHYLKIRVQGTTITTTEVGI